MIYLASSSPRRAELLRQLNIDFKQFAVNIDEAVLIDEKPLAYLNRIVQMKLAVAVDLCGDLSPVLVADTIVCQGDIIMGKPRDFEEFKTFMRRLNNSTHEVFTAIGIQYQQTPHFQCVTNTVQFASLSDQDMCDYWHTAEPQDKAGGYAIQGIGAMFIKKITGSFSAIMGLPLYEVMALLKKIGYRHGMN
ncbi:MAG: Maf family protein [Francisellaceae bacterium]